MDCIQLLTIAMLVFIVACGPFANAHYSEPEYTPEQEAYYQYMEKTTAGCCMHCDKGQACGNSCISWDKTCHQPPGCACN